MHEECGFYWYSQSRCTNLPTQSQQFLCDKETTAESCRGDIALIRRNAPNTYQHSNSCYRLQRQVTYARTTHYDELTVSTEPLSAGYPITFNMRCSSCMFGFGHSSTTLPASATFPLLFRYRYRYGYGAESKKIFFWPIVSDCVRIASFGGCPQPNSVLHIRHRENSIDVMVYFIFNTLICL